MCGRGDCFGDSIPAVFVCFAARSGYDISSLLPASIGFSFSWVVFCRSKFIPTNTLKSRCILPTLYLNPTSLFRHLFLSEHGDINLYIKKFSLFFLFLGIWPDRRILVTGGRNRGKIIGWVLQGNSELVKAESRPLMRSFTRDCPIMTHFQVFLFYLWTWIMINH